ncbi:MAG: hypothetical protein AAF799_07385 [Myxococcota bacterium]
MERFESGSSVIYCDDSHFPVVISTWIGAATLDNSQEYLTWMDAQLQRATREEVRLISISDSADAKRPPPEVRRLFVDWINNNEESTGDSFVVITNALVRGALTAIGWLAPSAQKVNTVKDLPTALSKARGLLAERGLTVPGGLTSERYVRPGQDAARKVVRSNSEAAAMMSSSSR